MAVKWNDLSGDWQGLASPTQAPRYQEIVDVIARFCPSGGSVLDIGCGEAVLRGFLPESVDYSGIEPSAKAVETALSSGSRIIHARGEDAEVGGLTWDCIIFNEVLYYSLDPVALVRKFARSLRPGGIITVSIYQRAQFHSLKARLCNLVDGRRPVSNVHCTKLVYDFMVRSGWAIELDKLVDRPNSSQHWRLIVAKPK